MTHHPGNRFAGMPAKGVVSLLACSAPAFAHHSKAEYDDSTFVEARGEVVSVLWSNPHLRFQVSTRSIDGNPQLWEVEGEDLSRLDRAGLGGRDLFEVGDVITFAGNPSTRNERRMYATHLVIENGGEVLLIQPALDVAAVLRQLLNEDGRAVGTDPVPPPTATSAADEEQRRAQERPSSGDR